MPMVTRTIRCGGFGNSKKVVETNTTTTKEHADTLKRWKVEKRAKHLGRLIKIE
jgi:hypothetical protein